MSNRFERGFVPPTPLTKRTSGGVDVVAVTAAKKETDLLPLGGALVNVYTTESTVQDSDWSITSNYFITPSGQALSRSTYSTLFDRLGTTWGSGNGSTTFNCTNILGFNSPPFTVSVSPTVYTTVGTYGSGNFINHPHTISNGNQNTFRYIPSDPTGPTDQRGNFNMQVIPAVSGTVNGDTLISPKGEGLRGFLCTEESALALPLGYVVAHLTPISSISTVLSAYPKLLVASGQVISASAYFSYVAAYGSTLPNLQGKFIRHECAIVNIGVNTAINNFGTSFASHSHRWTAGTFNRRLSSNQSPDLRNAFGSVSGAMYGDTPSSNYTLGPGNETRPYNTSVTYLIKVLP